MRVVRLGKRVAGLLAGLLAVSLLGIPSGAEPAVVAENVEHIHQVGGSTGGHSVVEGDRLYVGAYGLGMRIFDVSDPARPVQIGQWRPGPQADTADSVVDPGVRSDAVPDAAVIDGRHIAILNGTNRVPGTPVSRGTQQSEFLDVTDPANPVLLRRLVGPADGEAHNGDLVDERGWWLPSGGSGVNGLRIYDIRKLLAGEPVESAELFRANPVTLWENSPYRGERPRGGNFTHVHDVTVYLDWPVAQPDGTTAARDLALLAEGGSYLNNSGNTGSVFVVDITDPAAPVVLNRWLNPLEEPDTMTPLPTARERTAIRYVHEAQLLDADPSIMLVTDEDLHDGCDRGRLHVVKVTPDYTGAEKIAEWRMGVGTPAPICSTHVFSTHGSNMYIGAYNAGLQVVDLSDPAAPKRAGQYIAPGQNSWGALWHAGYVYVGDFGPRGLDVFQFAGDKQERDGNRRGAERCHERSRGRCDHGQDRADGD